jgi:hypothetical protein
VSRALIFSDSVFCPDSVFIRFILILIEKTTIISINSINQLILTRETLCFICGMNRNFKYYLHKVQALKVSSVFKETLRCFPSSKLLRMLHMQPSICKFIKITPELCRSLNYLTFQIILLTLINKKIKNPLSQVATTHHPNVFTFFLSLSRGRVGIAWAPSNNMMLILLSFFKELND